MKRVGVLCTFPSRSNEVVSAVESVVGQLDELLVVFNEHGGAPPWTSGYRAIHTICPETDLKDEGKFLGHFDDEDYIALLDDDIVYPSDYIDRLIAKHKQYEAIDAVIGVHGVIYPEFWDGSRAARMVYTFNLHRPEDTLVNQLGTGTVLLKAGQRPSANAMRGSAGFVDVRHARLQAEAGRPMICIGREREWMQQIPVGETLYMTVTSQWNPDVLREVLPFGGMSRLGRHADRFFPLRDVGVTTS